MTIARHDSATRTDLEIIESLDFEHTPACEHAYHESGSRGHTGPAFALIRVVRPCGCDGGGGTVMYVCKGSWVYAFGAGFTCAYCGFHAPRDDFWRLLAYVNGS